MRRLVLVLVALLAAGCGHGAINSQLTGISVWANGGDGTPTVPPQPPSVPSVNASLVQGRIYEKRLDELCVYLVALRADGTLPASSHLDAACPGPGNTDPPEPPPPPKFPPEG